MRCDKTQPWYLKLVPGLPTAWGLTTVSDNFAERYDGMTVHWMEGCRQWNKGRRGRMAGGGNGFGSGIKPQ